MPVKILTAIEFYPMSSTMPVIASIAPLYTPDIQPYSLWFGHLLMRNEVWRSTTKSGNRDQDES